MVKLRELYERAKDYPEVRVGITYVNIKTKRSSGILLMKY